MKVRPVVSWRYEWEHMAGRPWRRHSIVSWMDQPEDLRGQCVIRRQPWRVRVTNLSMRCVSRHLATGFHKIYVSENTRIRFLVYGAFWNLYFHKFHILATQISKLLFFLFPNYWNCCNFNSQLFKFLYLSASMVSG